MVMRMKGIGKLIWLAMGMAAMLFVGGCFDKSVSLVKKGHFSRYPDVTIGTICKSRFNSGKWSSEEESGNTCVYFRGKISKATREMLVKELAEWYSGVINNCISEYMDLLRRGIDPHTHLKHISLEDLTKRPEWKTVHEAETRFRAKKKELDDTIGLKMKLFYSSYSLPDGISEQYQEVRKQIRRYRDEYTREGYLRARRGEWNYSENKPDPDAEKYMTEKERNKNLAIWENKLAELDNVYAKLEDEFKNKRDEKIKQLEEKVEPLNNELNRLDGALPKAFKPLEQYLNGPGFWQVGSEIVFKWAVFLDGKTYRLDACYHPSLAPACYIKFMDLICQQ